MLLVRFKKENISGPAFYEILAGAVKSGSGQDNHYFPVGVFVGMVFKPV